MRIHVIGNAGSGKTTLANQLAKRFDCPHVELDALHWGPNWQPAETEQFRANVLAALSGSNWVVDGNYSKVRDIVWQRVHWVVWLDYSLPRTLWQLSKRSTRRIMAREELWEARNQESIHGQLFDADALIPYALKTHYRRRRQFSELLRRPENPQIQFVRLRSPKETQRWLSHVKLANNSPNN